MPEILEDGVLLSEITPFPSVEPEQLLAASQGVDSGLISVGALRDYILAYKAALAAIKDLVPGADKLPYFTGDDTAGLADLTSFGRSLIDDANAGAALTTLGFSAFVKTLVDDANAAAFYATLGIVPDDQIPSNLTASKAFRRGNILAAVTQTSGVPTGGVIERGSNASGEYVRLADGTQWCWMTESVTTAVDQVSGGLYTTGSVKAAKTYPAAFSAVPHDILKIDGPNNNLVFSNASPTTTASGTYTHFSSASRASATYTYRWFASGRWF